MPQPSIVFGDRPETILRTTPAPHASEANRVLLGTYLSVQKQQNGFYRVSTRRAGRGGWVDKDHVTESLPLRIFFVDVGQGDGTLVECPQGVVVVDGGRSRAFHKFLRHRYAPLLRNRGRVHIEAMIMSHPDWDHDRGLPVRPRRQIVHCRDHLPQRTDALSGQDREVTVTPPGLGILDRTQHGLEDSPRPDRRD